MKLSIVIPAFNEEKLIAVTLQSIRAAASVFAERGWTIEVIVCDNNSDDRTGELAREHGARVVFEPVNQIGRARHRGAEAASGDWLLFVDADSTPCPGLFNAVALLIEGKRCIGGGVTLRMDEFHFFAWLATKGWNGLSRLTGWAAGSFLFCEAAAYRAVGGFDPALYVGEELDLSRKLKRLGRQSGRRMRVVSKFPMLTSARKVRLYSQLELLRFLVSALLLPRRTMTTREACGPWYDGRR